MNKRKHSRSRLRRDVAIIFLSVIVAILLVKTDALKSVLRSAEEIKILSSFIVGLFFTSVFTTPVSIVALGEISLTTPLFLVAFFGACGAVVGDLIIFLFIKDSLTEDVNELLKMSHSYRRLHHIFKFRIFRFLTIFLGALIIASPLPDELGLAMMGISKMKLSVFVPVSFIMNFLGILLIGLIANSFI